MQKKYEFRNLEVWCIICLEFWLLWFFFGWGGGCDSKTFHF